VGEGHGDCLLGGDSGNLWSVGAPSRTLKPQILAGSVTGVLRFLSDPWIDAMARAAEAATGPQVDPPLVLQQVVTGRADGEAAWSITLGAGTIVVVGGRAESPTVTFTQDVETAAAVNRGELSAQAAFMTGRLRVGGDVQVLLDRQPALAEVDDIFALVRAETTYD
jgi:predicted lipid carrier protein YhbT